MATSSERILTTQLGSLPRSDTLLAMLMQIEKGEEVERDAFRRQVAVDMAEVIARQAEVGIDIAGDGELPRIGFSYYVKDRMSGFGGVAKRGTVSDFAKFPGYAALKMAAVKASAGDEADLEESASIYEMPEAQEEVRYDGQLSAVTEEMDIFSSALESSGHEFSGTFVSAASPGIISTTLLRNEAHPAYKDDHDYVMALARELKHEYDYIVSRGHDLQIDAPDLAMERQIMFIERPLSEFLARVELHIEALNLALADIPPDKVRLHVCYGNYDGPHIDDVELQEVLPLLYRANVGTLSIACANPRHQHDWKQFKRHPLPARMKLMPGVIDVTTNTLEHPEVVADRIFQFVDAVGDRERVIAGCDCGFSTFAGYVMVPADVAWKKLEMLSQGAGIASARLWG
ncbi:MAG: methionine synthase [Alphaproteobacteria bacterium]|jgi:5-methyltetrahydropteroyltriglutamate--homocysteine methyltransferase|nr:methionine synthase [Alphaproteobacteria bacterium]MDP6589930.1 methionine synthase [Alphaproteobacteria bacterium]MDP6816886.1 methionine synthase [Alphaproteobacteria bacterium]|tara:strand:+ start:280 stop:1485 length:1206 start_codon:yes stop_codon:yes gene_type:complete